MRPTLPVDLVGIFVRGFCMGAADVVPGVSGGTIAFITGIYERLLTAIQCFNLNLLQLLKKKQFKEAAQHTDLVFLIPLAAGIVSALLFFTRIVPLPELIINQPELVYGLFFGLILASIAVLIRQTHVFAGWNFTWLCSGIIIGLALVNLVPVNTPNAAWFIFLCGALAISAMILPGISGSFILLIMQKYSYIFAAIGRFDLLVIFPFALGIMTGLMLFSRLLHWLLNRFHHQCLTTIIGILVGSLWLIWPFQHRHYLDVNGHQKLLSSTPVWPQSLDATVYSSLSLAVIGAVLVVVIHTLAKRLR